MNTVTKPRKKLYIYPKITRDDFLKRIKENPFCIHTNITVRRALYVLDFCCLSRNLKKSEQAKGILEEAGLSAYIPTEAKKRKSDDPNFKIISRRKVYFDIEYYKFEIESSLDKKYSSNQIKKKKRDIKTVFKNIFNREPTQNELDSFIHGVSHNVIALKFFCAVNGVKYDSVRTKYSKIRKNDLRKNLRAELPRMYTDLEYLKYFVSNKFGGKQFLYYR